MGLFSLRVVILDNLGLATTRISLEMQLSVAKSLTLQTTCIPHCFVSI